VQNGFSLGPSLPLTPGPFPTAKDAVLPGIVADTCPDRWGRAVLRREEAHASQRERRTARTLTDVDSLVMVSDELRLGAIRISREQGGPFLAQAGPIPLTVDLGRLLAATRNVIKELDTDDDLKLLLAPGASLGGARPKAAIRDRGDLCMAKFPHPDDDRSVESWEEVALQLAQRAGIEVPDGHKLVRVLDEPVLVTKRFDRHGNQRRLFASAMTLLDARDRESHSYLDLVYTIRQVGDVEDLPRLWRRMVFNILITNTDDHLRNHGFLRTEGAWRLSPAYDLNPRPADLGPSNLTLAIDEADTTASLDLAFSVADQFGLSIKTARDIAAQVGEAIRHWREVALRIGIRRDEIERMAGSFEHRELELAVGANTPL
jgi:serine/threonine-protein kinase HipA